MYAVIKDRRTGRISVLWLQDIQIDLEHPECPFEKVDEVQTYRDGIKYLQQESLQ